MDKIGWEDHRDKYGFMEEDVFFIAYDECEDNVGFLMYLDCEANRKTTEVNNFEELLSPDIGKLAKYDQVTLIWGRADSGLVAIERTDAFESEDKK